MSDEWKTRKDRVDRRTGKGVRYRVQPDKGVLPMGLQPVTTRRAMLHGYPLSTKKFREVYKDDSKVRDLKNLQKIDFNIIIDASSRGLSSRWLRDNFNIPRDISDYVREQIFLKYIQEKRGLTEEEIAQINDPFAHNRGRDFLFDNMYNLKGDAWDRIVKKDEYKGAIPVGFKKFYGTGWDAMEYPSVFVLFPDGNTHWGEQRKINYLDALDEFDIPYFVIRRQYLYSADSDDDILEGKIPQRATLSVHEDHVKFAHKVLDNIQHPWENVKNNPYWVEHFETGDRLLDLWGKDAPTATLEDLRKHAQFEKEGALVMERLIKSGQFDFGKKTIAETVSQVEAIPPEERERMREEIAKKKMWGITGEERGKGLHELDIEDVSEEMEEREREKHK